MGVHNSRMIQHTGCRSTPAGLECCTNDASTIHVCKKRKLPSLVALKSKLVKRSRRPEHAMRDFIASWNVRDVYSLVEDYEALASLRRFVLAATRARQHAATARSDLGRLKSLYDAQLVFRGRTYSIHRALFAARCPGLRSHLENSNDPIEIQSTPGLTFHHIDVLLSHVYTGRGGNGLPRELASQLRTQFGAVTLDVRRDLTWLINSLYLADAMLVWPGSYSRSGSEGYMCHKCILAARSRFFTNLFARDVTRISVIDGNVVTRVELDESIVPRKYVHVILQAIYVDTVDLRHVIREPPHPTSGQQHRQQQVIKEAMELYEIAGFLEIPVLAHGCEDIIVGNLCLDNLCSIYQWSIQSVGSEWVLRQAVQYFIDEFLTISTSQQFLNFPVEFIATVLKSDFIQASELDIVKAILRWGEYQQIKAIEQREPNIVSSTVHSVSKKGVRRKDLDDAELRDILAPLTQHVRIWHVLPLNADVFQSALRRGIFQNQLNGEKLEEFNGLYFYKQSAWLRHPCHGEYVRPRLYMPYVEECKAVLHEHLSMGLSLEQLRRLHTITQNMPDNLYMVNCNGRFTQSAPQSPSNNFVNKELVPVPDKEVMRAMMQRERHLQVSCETQAALKLPSCDKFAIFREIQKRVIREFGWSDDICEVLENPFDYYPDGFSIDSSFSRSKPNSIRRSLTMRGRISDGNTPGKIIPGSSKTLPRATSMYPCYANLVPRRQLCDVVQDCAILYPPIVPPRRPYQLSNREPRLRNSCITTIDLLNQLSNSNSPTEDVDMELCQATAGITLENTWSQPQSSSMIESPSEPVNISPPAHIKPSMAGLSHHRDIVHSYKYSRSAEKPREGQPYLAVSCSSFNSDSTLSSNEFILNPIPDLFSDSVPPSKPFHLYDRERWR